MAALNIISAGAAKSLVSAVADKATVTGQVCVRTKFGAVGAMLQEVESGSSCDIIILTDTLLKRLILQGRVRPDSMVHIGHVKTGIAVCCNGSAPDAQDALDLRTHLITAEQVLCPDPAVASAGRMLVRALDQLGAAEQLRDKLVYFNDGLGVIEALLKSENKNTIGVIQVSEIVSCQELSLIGVLPEDSKEKIIYSIAISNNSENTAEAEQFVQALLAE